MLPLCSSYLVSSPSKSLKLHFTRAESRGTLFLKIFSLRKYFRFHRNCRDWKSLPRRFPRAKQLARKNDCTQWTEQRKKKNRNETIVHSSKTSSLPPPSPAAPLPPMNFYCVPEDIRLRLVGAMLIPRISPMLVFAASRRAICFTSLPPTGAAIDTWLVNS